MKKFLSPKNPRKENNRTPQIPIRLSQLQFQFQDQTNILQKKVHTLAPVAQEVQVQVSKTILPLPLNRTLSHQNLIWEWRVTSIGGPIWIWTLISVYKVLKKDSRMRWLLEKKNSTTVRPDTSSREKLLIPMNSWRIIMKTIFAIFTISCNHLAQSTTTCLRLKVLQTWKTWGWGSSSSLMMGNGSIGTRRWTWMTSSLVTIDSQSDNGFASHYDQCFCSIILQWLLRL